MQNEVSVLAAFFHMVIFMNNEKRIISFPAGKTYEHILHTSVHAHPIKRGFPKEPTSYVMFRKSGGEMEYLFRVKKTVDFYIQDLLSGTVSLSGIDNAELEQIKTYVLERKDLFGFNYWKRPEFSPLRLSGLQIFRDIAFTSRKTSFTTYKREPCK